MKRQQSSQEGSAKRHCPTRHFAMEMQRNQVQLDQLASGPTNNTQPWSCPPQQLSPQLDWSSNYNININNGNTIMYPNNMIAGYPTPTPFPMQLGPIQQGLIHQGSIQQAPIQQGQMQPEPIPFTPIEATSFLGVFNQTFTPNFVENIDWAPTNHVFQGPQGAMNEFYPALPQQQSQFQFNQQLWTPGPALLDPGNMPRPPIGQAVNTAPTSSIIGRNIPRRAPFFPPASRRTMRPKGHVSKDAVGVDITKIGQPQPPTLPTPSPEKSQAAVIPPLPVYAVPESTVVHNNGPCIRDTTRDQPGQEPQHEEHPAERGRPNSIDNPVVIDDDLEGLAPVKEFLERAKQDEAAGQAEKAPEDKQPEIEWYGDPAQYDAECYEHLRTPGCGYRAQGICVGWPRPEFLREQGQTPKPGRWVVYAVRCPRNKGGIVLRVAKPGLTIEEVMSGYDVQFGDIHLNVNFEDMDEKQVLRWSRYLLNAVPGVDDSITKWAPGEK
ncbi:hypothetical protein F5X97DRAFT_342283 [Nemania serpens]|nr:hypothetical protein F5X97DRAFT_342283 [Nemania serpens]